MANAKFMVTQNPGFFDGVKMHPRGTELDWSQYPDLKPSRTFYPLNREAAELLGKDALVKWDATHPKEAAPKK